MPVILRKSKIKKGFSFYLDINHNGKRWTEWLKIHIRNNAEPNENEEKISLAKKNED